ncbi:ankyrin domain protein (macronuclear) [Tetrahymena thermophila SB210]|uniref:Ankyrin domain protein n=1 Tax=Tetrahymena thermophila (strain SB210) TaxID=312017 RepID=Q22WQ3_TETTS|nr:ankyrin domain protein [Tetrahymena thermophila SB210]EAR89739.2 ankyrin domain protein [Tetrahymena thermophila SB210]|eukprot:XP_001009984.2 ankyrin domain protein [Tetrahymena thermophila SB210]
MTQQITVCCREFIKFICCITNDFQNMKMAIEKDNYEEFIAFFEKNKVNVQDYEEDTGNNPLHLTVKANRYDMVDYLLTKYESLEKEDKNFDGDTALMLAVLYSDLKMVRLLVEKGNVDINCKESEGFTPFMAACANGKLEIVEYLMNRNCKIYSKNQQGQTAIHRAAFYGEVQVIRSLLKNTKLQLTSRDSRGNTCLHFAAMRLNMTCFRYILKKLGSQKDNELAKKNQEGLTPVQVLIKSFNLIKKDDRVINEAEVEEYILNKNKPPPYLYESLKEQKPTLFNKVDQQKEQLIQKQVNGQPLTSKQVINDNNIDQQQYQDQQNQQLNLSKKNININDNQIQEQELQNFIPSASHIQDNQKLQNANEQQQQKPQADIDATETNNLRPIALKSPIQGDSISLFNSGMVNPNYPQNELINETNQLNQEIQQKTLSQRRKNYFSKISLKNINQLSKKNV